MSAIEWTERTWNPTTGCDRVSPGCDNCYALTLAGRLKLMGQPKYQNDGDPRTSGPGFGLTIHPDTLDEPLRRRKPTTYFVNSMSDLFHQDVPSHFIGSVFRTMARCPQHTFQVLTKRPQRMRAWTQANNEITCPTIPNVHLGTSIESDVLTFRADHLRASVASVRFLSLEPLLGPLPSLNLSGIDWVIVGGESGHGARPMHPDWARDIRDRCQDAGVAFFFKQWGAWGDLPRPTTRATAAVAYDGCHHCSPLGDDPDYVRWAHEHDHIRPNRLHAMYRVGKKAAGRELDGLTWDGTPS